jgi:hypothetical protein
MRVTFRHLKLTKAECYYCDQWQGHSFVLMSIERLFIWNAVGLLLIVSHFGTELVANVPIQLVM